MLVIVVIAFAVIFPLVVMVVATMQLLKLVPELVVRCADPSQDTTTSHVWTTPASRLRRACDYNKNATTTPTPTPTPTTTAYHNTNKYVSNIGAT